MRTRDPELDWVKALEHFGRTRRRASAVDYLLKLEPLAVRFNRGERSRDLYDAMLNVS